MRIVVCGAGEVGFYTAETLAKAGHRVSVIDTSAATLKNLEEVAEVRSFIGSATQAETLVEAGVGAADWFIAATNQDEINFFSAIIAKKLGAKKTIVRIHHRPYVESSVCDYQEICAVDHLICPEQLTSMAMLKQLQNPGALAIEDFAQNAIQMQRFTIKSGSSIIGIELQQYKMPRGLYLAVVERNNHSFVPNRKTILQESDTVTIVGESRRFEEVGRMFNLSRPDCKNIAIMGASLIAEWFIEKLISKSFQVRLFEPDHDKAFSFAERYPKITVINADPTDPGTYKREFLGEAQAFLAVSDDAEHNILSVLQARQLGSTLTMAVIHESTYLDLIKNLGVDYPFSPKTVAVRELLRLVDSAPVKKLATLAAGVADVYELAPVKTGTARDKQLKDVGLLAGHFIVAIQRQHDIYLPSATDYIREGDILIVVGPPGAERLLQELFVGR